MQTITVLRKTHEDGYIATYRFGITADGRYLYRGNNGKYSLNFGTRRRLENEIEKFVSRGYAPVERPARPIRKASAQVTEAPVEQQELNIAPF